MASDYLSRDILLTGGFVVDDEMKSVYRADLLIRDEQIARIGQDIPVNNEQEVQIIDCTDLIITAGFVDTHVHIESSMVLPRAFGEAVLPQGTTTAITDPHEVVNVAGAHGLREFLTEAASAPIDIFTVVPSSVPVTPLDTNGAGQFLAAEMQEFANRPDIVGLGEVMCYYDVAEKRPEIMDKIALFRSRHKTIDSHTSGMPDELLEAHVTARVQNDHECCDCEALLKRYQHGVHIYIREGSAARNARELLSCQKAPARPRTFCLLYRRQTPFDNRLRRAYLLHYPDGSDNGVQLGRRGSDGLLQPLSILPYAPTWQSSGRIQSRHCGYR